MQQGFTVLKLQFNNELSQLDLFAEAIGQRSEQETGVWLAGLDAAAEDALALPGGYFESPPIVCHLARGIGGAIRRARTRLPGGGQSPVAVIRIPRERMIGYGIASSLVHEVGHQGAALLGLKESLVAALGHAYDAADPAARAAWTLLLKWINEIIADVWAVSRIGISSTLGLIGIVSLPRRFVFRVNSEDPHPFPWIRVRLSCAIGHALYPHRQWQELAATWDTMYPPSGLAPEQGTVLRSLLAVMPAFVRALLSHRPISLRGRSLGEVLQMPTRGPDQLLSTYAAWRTRPGLMFAAPPSLVFAVFGRARIAGQLTPEEETQRLGQLITYWALHSTLDVLGTCARQWREVRPRQTNTTPLPHPLPIRAAADVALTR
jgi:hypothetical protein